MSSLTMRTRLANDGFSSKNLFFIFICLNMPPRLPPNTMSFRKICFWQYWVNARSARDKFTRFSSANGSSATCSTMEASRSSERRESGGFSMLAKRNSRKHGILTEGLDWSMTRISDFPTKYTYLDWKDWSYFYVGALCCSKCLRFFLACNALHLDSPTSEKKSTWACLPTVFNVSSFFLLSFESWLTCRK